MILFFLMVMGFFGMVASAGAVAYLIFSKNGLRGLRDGRHWEKRLDRLEVEMRRLGDGETRGELEDEVRLLNERVEFLENLLAERAGGGSLPPGGDRWEAREVPAARRPGREIRRAPPKP